MKRICLKLVSGLCIVATISATTPAFAATVDEVVPPCPTQQTEQIMPLIEETVWVTRNHNGQLQKRLWSITRGIWLTDWIDC